jgi:hypothetical protein
MLSMVIYYCSINFESDLAQILCYLANTKSMILLIYFSDPREREAYLVFLTGRGLERTEINNQMLSIRL